MEIRKEYDWEADARKKDPVLIALEGRRDRDFLGKTLLSFPYSEADARPGKNNTRGTKTTEQLCIAFSKILLHYRSKRLPRMSLLFEVVAEN